MEHLEQLYNQLADTLQRTESMLKAFGDSAPNLFWVKDTEGVYLHCNAPHAHWLGANTPEEVVGTTDTYWADKSRALLPNVADFHEFGEMCSNSDLVAMERGKEVSVFLEFGNVRGEFCALRVSKIGYYVDDVLSGTVGSAVDVTERVQLTERHARLLDKFRDRLLLCGDTQTQEMFHEIYDDFIKLADRHKFLKRAEHHG